MDDVLINRGRDQHVHRLSCNPVLDKLLEGGLECDIITTMYGPAGSGKSNMCMFATVSAASQGKQVIYIDTEGGFSVERFKQITDDNLALLDQIIILHPTNFEEQKKVFAIR